MTLYELFTDIFNSFFFFLSQYKIFQWIKYVENLIHGSSQDIICNYSCLKY